MEPADVLFEIARELREERSVVSAHVVEPAADPTLGMSVARAPRCREAPAEYAIAIESVREGYLLHYSEPRLVAGVERELALLAGDRLYAFGLERLAALGDLAAIRELADLISACAVLHADGPGDPEAAEALWSAAAMAIGGGPEAIESAAH